MILCDKWYNFYKLFNSMVLVEPVCYHWYKITLFPIFVWGASHLKFFECFHVCLYLRSFISRRIIVSEFFLFWLVIKSVLCCNVLKSETFDNYRGYVINSYCSPTEVMWQSISIRQNCMTLPHNKSTIKVTKTA